jgi:hypothetical protein
MGGDGEDGEVVREDELPVVVLQVPSRLDEAGTPKKVRATLGGIRARRLAAHRRLVVAISESRSEDFFSDPVGEFVDSWIASAVNGDGVDPGSTAGAAGS